MEILGETGEIEWSADLNEKAPAEDEDAYKYANAVLTFHGYSAAGKAEGKLVYANYGTQADFEELDSAGSDFAVECQSQISLFYVGIELKDKIVLVRYGINFRGMKVSIELFCTALC